MAMRTDSADSESRDHAESWALALACGRASLHGRVRLGENQRPPGGPLPVIDRYVDAAHPSEPRFQAFRRTFVSQTPSPGDADALAELRRDTEAVNALSLYLHAKTHYEAIITVTEEGDLVLGLGLDDPDNHPETQREASELLASMMDEFQASSGIAGVELPPPQSAAEWRVDGLVMLRVGKI